jgi:hypothetical protein
MKGFWHLGTRNCCGSLEYLFDSQGLLLICAGSPRAGSVADNASATWQVPAELAEAVQTSKRKGSETDAEEGQFPGVAGVSAISKSSKPPGELKFGEIKKRTLDNAIALRQSLAAS